MRKHNRQILVCLFLFSAVMFSCHDLFAAEWVVMETGNTIPLRDIWGSSPEDVFAVGDSGTILHYDGTVWEPDISGTTLGLKGVWGSSSSDVFAVGSSGTILHYNGSSWSAMSSGTTTNLYGIWGSSSSDVFAVGSSGTILHYNGSSWSAMSSGTTTNLYGIWGSSSSDVFAVGSSGTILHYNGSSWSAMGSGTTYSLQAVWGSSTNDVIAVGDHITFRRYNGSVWSSMKPPVPMDWWTYWAVWGTSPNNLYVGSWALSQYDGSTWHTGLVWEYYYIEGIWGSSAQDVFAAVTNGKVAYYGDDSDRDGIINDQDNCPYIVNPDQADDDNDGVGNVCDNCLNVANHDQGDFNFNGTGDACEDSDADGFNDNIDNCPSLPNLLQEDIDGDGYGDACDEGDNYAVLDTQQNKVFVFDMNNNLLHSTDLSVFDSPTMMRDDGKSGWLVKGIVNGFWKICHIDTSGAVRLLFTNANVNTGGSSYSGVHNGNIVVNNIDTGNTFLYDKSGILISSKDVWNDPEGWSFDYTKMGSVAGLIDGNIAVFPELGASAGGGVGYTPYVYIYDSNLNLIKKSDISSEHILVYSVVGLSNGGFAGLGNTDGGDRDTHLFHFNSDGSLASRYDMRQDIPSITSSTFMGVGITATEDGGVIVTQYNGSKVWIYHSPPNEVDLTGAGVTNIGGVGGSYFQATIPGCTVWPEVISKYNAYVNGQAAWSEVIECYQQYVSNQ